MSRGAVQWVIDGLAEHTSLPKLHNKTTVARFGPATIVFLFFVRCLQVSIEILSARAARCRVLQFDGSQVLVTASLCCWSDFRICRHERNYWIAVKSYQIMAQTKLS